MIRVIVTDIEGTTSSISFVKDVLFPYAAAHMEEFLEHNRQRPEVQQALEQLQQEAGEPVETVADANRILQQWIREDRKATPLKALQGMIWRAGYESGAYRAHLYPDVRPRLERWREQGVRLFVYSSGSVAAQRLFFRYSEAGDLTPLFEGYFDTTTGGKRDADSYRSILAQVGEEGDRVLFLSDIAAELDAASEAGMHVTLLDRDGEAGQSPYPVAASFDDIDLGAL